MNDWFFWEYARIREAELLCEARGIRNARADANRRAITYIDGFRKLITPEDSCMLDTDLRAEIRFPGWMESAKTFFWLVMSIAITLGIARLLK